MKIKKCSKKLISMLMALIICLSAFPLTSFGAYITDMNSNAQFGVVSGSVRLNLLGLKPNRASIQASIL